MFDQTTSYTVVDEVVVSLTVFLCALFEDLMKYGWYLCVIDGNSKSMTIKLTLALTVTLPKSKRKLLGK